ncbi:glycoside hydrolase family 19 protein [uncultured Aquitalea sp.]|uniref:glycoside hydrolase family 19 protein n=1 Tax=uncultured Aquitalea sp. TaxID=540272 RepID=UPI0025DA79B0|nr:glycoside hydrolase family 19 protein [uncultured Aquitalea sp.]
MALTETQLVQIMPQARQRAGLFVGPLNAAMAEFGISTPAQQAAFLAQIGHESGQLRYVRELASGEAYDTGAKALRLGNTPEADGDGQRYKGRGLIQITGQRNYQLCGFALQLDLIAHPELLELPLNACRSAAWFWSNENLNALADKGAFDAITQRINGGQNGRAERRALWAAAKKVLGVTP